jgi:hypothetical protein
MNKLKNREINLSEKDTEDIKKKIDLTKNLMDATSMDHIDMNENAKTSKLSCQFYIDNLIMSTVMESFYSGDEINYKEIDNRIHHKAPKWIWFLQMSKSDINRAVFKLIWLGFIQSIKSKDENNQKFRITDDGIKALKEQIFQNLEASSFFSYQTYIMNRRSFFMTILMLLVTIASVVVTIISLKRPY